MRSVPATLLSVVMVVAAVAGAAGPAVATDPPDPTNTVESTANDALATGVSAPLVPDGPVDGDVGGAAAADPDADSEVALQDGRTYYLGQTLAGSGVAPGTDVQLRRVTTFDDQGSPNETVLVDTVAADENGEFALETAGLEYGDYVVRDAGGDRLAEIELVEQRFGTVAFSPDRVDPDDDGAGATTTLELDSNRAEYEVHLTAERDGDPLSAARLAAAIESPGVTTVDTDDDGTADAVRPALDDDGTVTVDFTGFDTGVVTVTVDVVDTTAVASASVGVGVAPDDDDGDDSDDGDESDEDFEDVWDAPLPTDPTRAAADAALEDGATYVAGQVLFGDGAGADEQLHLREVTRYDDAGDPVATRLVDTIAADDDGEFFVETGRLEAGDYVVRGVDTGYDARFELGEQRFSAFAFREPAAGPNGTALLTVDANRAAYELYLTADRDDEDVPVGTLENAITQPDARGVDWAHDRTTELDVVGVDVTATTETIRIDASALPDGEYDFTAGVPDATPTASATVVIDDGVARVPDDGDDSNGSDDGDHGDDSDDRNDGDDASETEPLVDGGTYDQGIVLRSTAATSATPDEDVQVRAVLNDDPLETTLRDTVAANGTGSYRVDTASLEPGEYIVRGSTSGELARFDLEMSTDEDGDDSDDSNDGDDLETAPLEDSGTYDQGVVLRSTAATSATPDEDVQVRAVLNDDPLETALRDTVAANGTGSYRVDTASLEPGEYIVRGSTSGELARFDLEMSTDEDGDGTTATDPDGDGLLEDMNGDGAVTVLDVVELLATYDTASPAMQAQLDFNDDGRLSILDVLALLAEL